MERKHILEILNDLGKEEFEEFKWYLEDPDGFEGLGLKPLPKSLLENADRKDTATRLVNKYPRDRNQIIKYILGKSNRNDLAENIPKGTCKPS